MPTTDNLIMTPWSRRIPCTGCLGFSGGFPSIEPTWCEDVTLWSSSFAAGPFSASGHRQLVSRAPVHNNEAYIRRRSTSFVSHPTVPSAASKANIQTPLMHYPRWIRDVLIQQPNVSRPELQYTVCLPSPHLGAPSHSRQNISRHDGFPHSHDKNVNRQPHARM